MQSGSKYKRNQVDEAIAAVLRRDRNGASQHARTRIKRLLDLDRVLGPEVESGGPARRVFAFYGEEAPGKGVEVWFSDYEAFALLIALRVLDHGWPQGAVVRMMREVRRKLEREHRRILDQDPAALFDQTAVLSRARAGMPAVSNTDPTFLAIVTRASSKRTARSGSPHAVDVCRGQEELVSFIIKRAPPGMATTSLELVGSAHALAHYLARTEPRSRGRRR
jgi:hypothetical protein